MPCTGGGLSYEQLAEERLHQEQLVQAACSACALLEEFKIPIPAEAMPWWRRHKIHDAKQKQDAERIEIAKKNKATALAKLTPEELALLGLRT